ncbi:MAG: RNHCP domain-containing protein [Myxococcota bacterium]
MDVRERARALLAAARTRGDIRKLAPELDADPTLRQAVIEEGRRRGVAFDADVASWPSKRVLRRARGREAESRERLNPIARDEPFTCENCGREVPAHGRTARNHCPWCLCSKHVDLVPGDRASDCGGIMDPQRLELIGGHPVIHHLCRRCGAKGRVRAVLDGTSPDQAQALARLSAREPR